MIRITQSTANQWMQPHLGNRISDVCTALKFPDRTAEVRQLASEVRAGNFKGLPIYTPDNPNQSALKIRSYALVSGFLNYFLDNIRSLPRENGVLVLSKEEDQELKNALSQDVAFNKFTNLLFDIIRKKYMSCLASEFRDFKNTKDTDKKQLFNLLSSLPTPYPADGRNHLMLQKLPAGLENQLKNSRGLIESAHIFLMGLEEIYDLSILQKYRKEDLTLDGQVSPRTLSLVSKKVQNSDLPAEILLLTIGAHLILEIHKLESRSTSIQVGEKEISNLEMLIRKSIRISRDEASLPLGVFSLLSTYYLSTDQAINNEGFLEYKPSTNEKLLELIERMKNRGVRDICHCPAEFAIGKKTTETGDEPANLIVEVHNDIVGLVEKYITPNYAQLAEATIKGLISILPV